MLPNERVVSVLEKVASLRMELNIGGARSRRGALLGHAIASLMGGGVALSSLGAAIGAGKGRRAEALLRALGGGLAGKRVGGDVARYTAGKLGAENARVNLAGRLAGRAGSIAGGHLVLRGLK